MIFIRLFSRASSRRRQSSWLAHRFLTLAFLLSLAGAGQPVGAADAPNPAADPRLAQAVAWATQQVGTAKLWLDDGATLCDQFVENAFGVTAQYPTAYDMWLAIGKTADPAQRTLASLQRAPAGAIVFFEKNKGNSSDGHVGIYLGGDQFVGVITGGHVRTHGVKSWNDTISPFLGWASPRSDWPGYAKGKPIVTTTRPAPPKPPAPSAQVMESATRAFQSQWQGGEALARNLWGPSNAKPEQEAYAEAPGGYRLVQYFDKGRMELTNPAGGTVTNGLLATEMITGQMQMGNLGFESASPAAIPIAGDPDNPGPTYAQLGGRAAKLLAPVSAKPKAAITATVSAKGDVTESAPAGASDVRTLAAAETVLTAYDSETKHNLPAAFAAYRAKVGMPVIGYAKSEPFVTTVEIAGVKRQVVVQVFERRVLTYNAANGDAFKVEMGNIGQHYYKWRHGGT